MKKKMSAFGTALGTLVMASTVVLSGAGPASAADGFSFDFPFIGLPPGQHVIINVYNTTWNDKAGSVSWQQDPSGGFPGDALTARDELRDGYGIEARLSTGRVASTRGHDSPYTVTKTGNLPEGNTYTMRVCVVKGDWEKCSQATQVKA
ncbi:hypothetical protein ACFWUQ_13035 [Streptomyces sp. NPDC058662]|uniref:hypothetical protein n=1 Tax=Streptomyces sp. NPDC058662 TaxID=3346583 RepID=UPI0036576718